MGDVERWNLWTPSIRRIKRLDRGEFAVGSRALVFQPKLPPALWRVTVLAADRGFTWVSTGPGIRVTGLHQIEPAGTGSSVTLAITYEGMLAGLTARLLGSITEKYLGWEAAGLKKWCERPPSADR
jgi:hypothetical protein